MRKRKHANGGKIITESQLRGFTKCSQFYHYGGEVAPEPALLLARSCFERIMADCLRYPNKTPYDILGRSIGTVVAKAAVKQKMTESEQETAVRTITLMADDFFKLFHPAKYTIVYGALPLFVKHESALVSVRISGVLRCKDTKSLHLIDFSPYSQEHSVVNDPMTPLKLHAMKQFMRNSLDQHRNKSILHTFSVTAKGLFRRTSIDSSSSDLSHLARAEQLLNLMDSGHHFPLVPCPYACPFKEKCRPGDTR